MREVYSDAYDVTVAAERMYLNAAAYLLTTVLIIN